MPATKISDLLPIPDGVKKPHAYQVFGLEGGEQDSEKIKAAVAAIYQRLEAAKADTDPELWQKAAKIVEKARAILSDPNKRAALDARFGVIRFDDPPEQEVPAVDPLAGVLPASDPLAGDPLRAVVPGGDPMAAAPTAPAVGMAPTPGMAPSAAEPAQNAAAGYPNTTPMYQGQSPTAVEDLPIAAPAAMPTMAPSSGPVVSATKKSSSSRRRRKSNASSVLFGMFILGMFGVIFGLLYFLMFGPGRLSVITKDGEVSITTEKPENPTPTTRSQVRPVNRDRVLGDVPKGRGRKVGSLADADPMKNAIASATGQMTEPSPPPSQQNPDMPMTNREPTNPEPANPVSTTKPAPEPSNPGNNALPVQSGETQSPPMEMNDEMIAAANAAIANVEKLIQGRDWEQMKPVADKLTEMTLTDEQSVYADALYNLADLATYYRVGISKGIGTLKTASTFELTEGLPVLVVETSADGLTIRSNARNRSYTLDDMPFRLADALASFALSKDKPDTIAARACFQAIAPKSTPEYREEALSWLEFVNDDVEGVDTKEVVKAIKKLFPD